MIRDAAEQSGIAALYKAYGIAATKEIDELADAPDDERRRALAMAIKSGAADYLKVEFDLIQAELKRLYGE